MIGHLDSESPDVMERVAIALERLVSLQERAEVRLAVKGLLKIRTKYAEEPERTALRVVR